MKSPAAQRPADRILKIGALGGVFCFGAMLLLPAPYFYLFLNVSRQAAEHYLDSLFIRIASVMLPAGAMVGLIASIVLLVQWLWSKKALRSTLNQSKV